MSGEQRTAKLWQGINEAIVEEMERDERVILLGQDVALPGGSFGVTRGLLDRFGPRRVRDTPISEAAMMGAAVGASLVGLRPICEFLFIDFLPIGADQLVNQAAKQKFFANGKLDAPLVLRAGIGTSFGMGAQHSQSLEGWYAHVPGLKVCWGGTARDAKGLLKSAIRDDGPVLVLESLGALSKRSPVEGEDYLVPLGVADVARPGRDLTIVCYGGIRTTVDVAAERLAEQGVEAEVVDLRTIAPWDVATVCESVSKTSRCLVVTEAMRDFGPGGEIASQVSEECFDDLDAPVARVGAPRVPAAQFRQYDEWRVPGAADVIGAVARMLNVTLETKEA